MSLVYCMSHVNYTSFVNYLSYEGYMSNASYMSYMNYVSYASSFWITWNQSNSLKLLQFCQYGKETVLKVKTCFRIRKKVL